MKFTGVLKEPVVNYLTGKLTVLFEPCEDFREAYEELKGCEKLSLEIKKYRRRRSLDANAYYWVLVTKLARVLHLSNQEVHNMMLEKYGETELFDGRESKISIPDTEEADNKVRNSSEYHLRSTSEVHIGDDGNVYRTYILLRGSHTYNTEEMARLIDGLASECKDAGIPDSEIATPDEKRILKERYGVNIG